LLLESSFGVINNQGVLNEMFQIWRNKQMLGMYDSTVVRTKNPELTNMIYEIKPLVV
jgi:hypothetical protein